MTDEKQTAEDYAANNSSDFVVIEIDVDESLFCADDEFCKELFTVKESLSNGSVYVDSDISINNAYFTFFEDFEEVE